MSSPLATAELAAPLASDHVAPTPFKPQRWIGDYSGDRPIKIASVLTLVAIWYFAAAMLPSSVMPAPHTVVGMLWTEMVTGPIWTDVLITLTRIAIAFSIAMLFIELLGRSDGIGYKIEFYYQMFNISEVLAHALLFLLIMLFLGIVLLGKIERHLFRWRPVLRRR